MKNVMTINNLLEIAQRLPIQDQEECVHILSKRIIEEKRKNSSMRFTKPNWNTVLEKQNKPPPPK